MFLSLKSALNNRFALPSLLKLYPATAAYSAYDLGNKRGSVTESEGTVVNPVQRWRRGLDDALQMFTAAEVAGGEAVDWVVPTDVRDLYSNAMYFDGVDDYVKTSLLQTNNSNWAIEWTGIIPNAGFGYVASTRNSRGWALDVRGSGKFNMNFLSVDEEDFAGYAIPFNELHTWKVEYDTTGNTLTLFEDGIQVDQVTMSGDCNLAGDDELHFGSYKDGTASFKEMVMYDVTFYEGGVAVSNWEGYGNTNGDWLDQIGSNNGTVNGSPALFTGQGYDAYLLTEYDQHDTGLSALYGSARYFNGTSTEVALNSTVTLVGDFSLSFSCFFDVTSVNQVLMGSGASNMVQLNSANQWRLDIGGTANIIAGTSGTTGVTYDVTVARVGTVVTLTLNGTDSVTDFGNSNNFIIDYIGSRGGSRWVNGSIWDVTIDGSHYTGLGTSVTAWEDTIGSNDGTETSGATFQGQGVAYDLTQTTAANQPLVVSGGALTVDGLGNVAPEFDGVNDSLSSSLVPPSSCTMMGVAEFDVVGSTSMIIGARDAAQQRSYIAATSSSVIAIGVGSGAVGTVTPVVGETYLITGSYSGTSVNCAVDGVNETGTQAAPVNAIHGYSLGALNDAGTDAAFMDGHIAAVLVYNTDQTANRADIEAKLSTIVTTAIS